jgi:uncharacterized glyoxalase superfamily protein PhnB
MVAAAMRTIFAQPDAEHVREAAQLQRSPQDQHYGDRDSYIIDPFGH